MKQERIKIELKQWALSDAKELTSLCNAVNRRFLSQVSIGPLFVTENL